MASDLATSVSRGSPPGGDSVCVSTDVFSLNGPWLFRLDRQDRGNTEKWFRREMPAEDWTPVTVPHTWQIDADSSEYQGAAWYRTAFEAPERWAGQSVRVEFEAAYHSAGVWLNGLRVGEHLRSGYTAFMLDLTRALRPGGLNTLAVRVDNSFDDAMLPRGKSFDWALDGGIIRPVQLLITPRVFIERLDVDALPDLDAASADLDIRAVLRNDSEDLAELTVSCEVFEDVGHQAVAKQRGARTISVKAGGTGTVALPRAVLRNPRLWHFDHPHLYQLRLQIEREGKAVHSATTTFGVRKIEVKERGFHLNGERVWLMGVERMAGSNPR